MMQRLHDLGTSSLVPVGVMNTHQRLFAGRADRRTTTSRCRPVIVFGFTLTLLATACGSDPAADSTIGASTPPATLDEIVSETVDLATTDSDTGDSELAADYTADELARLLDPPTYHDVLDAPDPEPFRAASPEAALSEIAAELDKSAGSATSATPLLDQVGPIDDAPTGTVIGIREGRRINEAGEANRLDEAAALACGNVEIALTALDEGRADEAADHLRTASTMAADTSVPAMNAWSSILEQSATDVAAARRSPADGSPLLAFLTACTQGGYEL